MLPGCGSGGDGKTVETEDEQVKQVIREFDDVKNHKAGFTNTFAKGAAPAEAQRKSYFKNTFAPGKVSISGDTAKVQVKVLDEAREKVQREVEWTCVKEGGLWKLKSAPLQ